MVDLNEFFFFQRRKDVLIIVAKRRKVQEKIAGVNAITFDDRALNALFRFAKEVNKNYEIRLTDASEKVGAVALTIYDLWNNEVAALKESFIKLLKKELREG